MRPVLSNETVVNHMASDWRKADYAAINEYVYWATQWQDGFIEAGWF
jgi:hypothetical protein